MARAGGRPMYLAKVVRSIGSGDFGADVTMLAGRFGGRVVVPQGAGCVVERAERAGRWLAYFHDGKAIEMSEAAAKRHLRAGRMNGEPIADWTGKGEALRLAARYARVELAWPFAPPAPAPRPEPAGVTMDALEWAYMVTSEAGWAVASQEARDLAIQVHNADYSVGKRVTRPRAELRALEAARARRREAVAV